MFWRMLGVKVGKRLYDPDAGIIEKTLVTIGDDCALNEGSLIQGHSMEGPRHRAATASARRPLLLAGAARGTRAPRRHKAVRI